jgi:hypothetical protein
MAGQVLLPNQIECGTEAAGASEVAVMSFLTLMDSGSIHVLLDPDGLRVYLRE